MSALLESMALGLETALITENLTFCFLGVLLGTALGVLPGIGALTAVSMLFPITYHMGPTAGLIMLAGIYFGTAYGGSTAAILLNVPGTPSSAVACLDGYPMARQGRAGVALFGTAIASFVGASIGIVIMMMFTPWIVAFAFEFGPTEYFALMVLGLVAAATISSGSAAKGIAMVVLGMLLGTVGTDVYTGAARFNFGTIELADGIGLVAIAMGLFGITEIIASIRASRSRPTDARRIALRSMIPDRDDVRRSWLPMLRGSGIGSFLGGLPGAGSLIASFMAYALEKKISRDPSRFGHGAIEGVISPEAANNAAEQTAFIPTLALGIPGSATMALMIGVFMTHGIVPGPTLIAEHPDMFWGLVMSFWLANILLLILNIPLVGLWVRLLSIPYHLLYPAILMLVCMGVYSIDRSPFDVGMVVAFGALGYAMRLLEFPAAPLVLGFVLGPLMEEHFRRAMLISRGDFLTFLERPISGTTLALAALLLVWSGWSAYRPRPEVGSVGRNQEGGFDRR